MVGMTVGVTIGLFLFGLMALIVYQIFRGGLNVKGLLSEKDGSGKFSFARMQALAVSVYSVIYYFVLVLRSDTSALPEPPAILIGVFAASSGAYLLNKKVKSRALS